MAQKLKAAGSEGEKFTQLVMDSAQQIWLAGLGAFAVAQTEGPKIFNSLVKEGESIQARASKAAGAQLSQVGKSAAGAWDRLEQVFEERVSKSLNRLGVPTYKDIQALSQRVDQLNASVQELLKAGGARTKPAATKRAPKTVARDASRV
ncbi:MAG TPA: phasin family protein [Burkholderiales bacterium]|nr:phasin family protein [Burkholderiales bacterium]